jgi:hypothetical protein
MTPERVRWLKTELAKVEAKLARAGADQRLAARSLAARRKEQKLAAARLRLLFPE